MAGRMVEWKESSLVACWVPVMVGMLVVKEKKLVAKWDIQVDKLVGESVVQMGMKRADCWVVHLVDWWEPEKAVGWAGLKVDELVVSMVEKLVGGKVEWMVFP